MEARDGPGHAHVRRPDHEKRLYSRYAGTYAISDGRVLRIEWDGDSLVATFPGGTRSQVFLKSPTEEAIASPDHFLFVLDSSGRLTTVRMMRGATEAWRAERER